MIYVVHIEAIFVADTATEHCFALDHVEVARRELFIANRE